jgi:hypothetical protein
VAKNDPRGRERTSATAIGKQYTLGTCTRTLRAPRSSLWFGIGGTLLGILIFGAVGILVSPYVAPIAAAVFAVVLLVARRRVWPPKVNLVFWYTDGLAQLIPGEPRPRVVHWADAAAVTAMVETSGESDLTTVTSCTVTNQAGVAVTVGAGFRPATPRDVLREAARVLAPRLAAPLISAYDAGQPVVFGTTRIDRSGISSGRKAMFTSWQDMRKIDGRIGNIVPEIVIHTATTRSRTVTLSSEPNCVFLFDVARHAAARHSVLFHDVIPAAAPGHGAGWSAQHP